MAGPCFAAKRCCNLGTPVPRSVRHLAAFPVVPPPRGASGAQTSWLLLICPQSFVPGVPEYTLSPSSVANVGMECCFCFYVGTWEDLNLGWVSLPSSYQNLPAPIIL